MEDDVEHDEDDPEFIHIGDPIDKADIRDLLREMDARGVTTETAKLFTKLSVEKPRHRLTSNLYRISLIMEKIDVEDVLVDGITPNEKRALLELDKAGYSLAARRTARCLLNVKERFIYAKQLAGLYRKARTSEGYLSIE